MGFLITHFPFASPKDNLAASGNSCRCFSHPIKSSALYVYSFSLWEKPGMRVASLVGSPLLNPLLLAGEEANEKGAGYD